MAPLEIELRETQLRETVHGGRGNTRIVVGEIENTKIVVGEPVMAGDPRAAPRVPKVVETIDEQTRDRHAEGTTVPRVRRTAEAGIAAGTTVIVDPVIGDPRTGDPRTGDPRIADPWIHSEGTQKIVDVPTTRIGPSTGQRLSAEIGTIYHEIKPKFGQALASPRWKNSS